MLYVDNVIITASDINQSNNMFQQLAKKYTIKDLGPICQFLNIQITPLYDKPTGRCIFE